MCIRHSQWTQQLGTSGADRADSATVDTSNNIFVTGYTAGGFDGNTTSGGSDIFLVKYNSSGTKQWTKQFGSSDNETLMNIALDSSENIHIMGYTNGDLDGNTNSGLRDIFLLKYNSDGVLQ